MFMRLCVYAEYHGTFAGHLASFIKCTQQTPRVRCCSSSACGETAQLLPFCPQQPVGPKYAPVCHGTHSVGGIEANLRRLGAFSHKMRCALWHWRGLSRTRLTRPARGAGEGPPLSLCNVPPSLCRLEHIEFLVRARLLLLISTRTTYVVYNKRLLPEDIAT